jgi:hypothetical protein
MDMVPQLLLWLEAFLKVSLLKPTWSSSSSGMPPPKLE